MTIEFAWKAVYRTNRWLAVMLATYYRWTAFHKNPRVWKFAVKLHEPFMSLHSRLCRHEGYCRQVRLATITISIADEG